MPEIEIGNPEVYSVVVGDPLAAVYVFVVLLAIIAGLWIVVINLLRKYRREKMLQKVPDRLGAIQKTHQELGQRVSKLEGIKKTDR